MINETKLQNILSETQHVRDLLHAALNEIAKIEVAGRQLYDQQDGGNNK